MYSLKCIRTTDTSTPESKAHSQKHIPSPLLLKSVNRQDADCQAPHGRARSDFLAAKVMVCASENNR